MRLTLVNATLFIDLDKCLAAPIHLLKGNVIRAYIILYLSVGSEYVTLPSLTISCMSNGNKQSPSIDTLSRHIFFANSDSGDESMAKPKVEVPEKYDVMQLT